eukprot:9187546-Karenia_brevis.AAC.1
MALTRRMHRLSCVLRWLSRLGKSSGVFDIPNMFGPNKSFTATTWNGRAVIPANPKYRHKKMALLNNMVKTSKVVLLQELHGDEDIISRYLNRYS